MRRSRMYSWSCRPYWHYQNPDRSPVCSSGHVLDAKRRWLSDHLELDTSWCQHSRTHQEEYCSRNLLCVSVTTLALVRQRLIITTDCIAPEISPVLICSLPPRCPDIPLPSKVWQVLTVQPWVYKQFTLLSATLITKPR